MRAYRPMGVLETQLGVRAAVIHVAVTDDYPEESMEMRHSTETRIHTLLCTMSPRVTLVQLLG